MKQQVLFITCTLVFALRATDPEPSQPIVLKNEEMNAILAHEETYAYFGGAVKSSLTQDLPVIYNASQNQGIPHDNLDKVCTLIAEGKTTAPKQMLQAALEEAATSLAVAPRLTSQEIEHLANSIETYYTQLDNGAVDVQVSNTYAPEDRDETATRSTFKNKVFVGNVSIFGDNNVRGSANVSGNVTVRGSETVLSNLTVGGNVTIAGAILSSNGGSGMQSVILNNGQPGPLTIGTTNATPLTFITNNINRVQVDQTGNTTLTGNLRLSQATPNVSTNSGSGLTSGIIDLGIGGGSGTKVSLFDIGSRNLFEGYYAITPNPTLASAADNIAIGTNALQSITTGTGNVAIGPFANTTLAVANNTVAIGVSANAQTSTDSVVIGNSATAVGNPRSIVLGSRDSTNSGAAPRAGGADAIAIGSASGTLAGASASGIASTALGASDGSTAGASASALRSVAIGTGASVNQTDAIILGNVGNANVSVGIGTNQPSAKLTVSGTGVGGVTPLQLVTPPPSTGTDFLLTIDGSGNVRQSSSSGGFGNVIVNGGQAGPLTIGTTNATPLTFITAGVNRLQIDQTGNSTINAANLSLLSTGTIAITTTNAGSPSGMVSVAPATATITGLATNAPTASTTLNNRVGLVIVSGYTTTGVGGHTIAITINNSFVQATNAVFVDVTHSFSTGGSQFLTDVQQVAGSLVVTITLQGPTTTNFMIPFWVIN